MSLYRSFQSEKILLCQPAKSFRPFCFLFLFYREQTVWDHNYYYDYTGMERNTYLHIISALEMTAWAGNWEIPILMNLLILFTKSIAHSPARDRDGRTKVISKLETSKKKQLWNPATLHPTFYYFLPIQTSDPHNFLHGIRNSTGSTAVLLSIVKIPTLVINSCKTYCLWNVENATLRKMTDLACTS